MLEGGIAGGREVRAVREGTEGAREGGRNQLLLIHCDYTQMCIDIASTLHGTTCWQNKKQHSCSGR